GHRCRYCAWWVKWRYFAKGEVHMIIFIIIGMAVVTMVPRFIPAFIVNNIIFKDWINNWLQSIPYAALGALIFPAVLTVKEGSPQVGLVGALVAVVLSFFGLNIILVVIASIATVYFMTM